MKEMQHTESNINIAGVPLRSTRDSFLCCGYSGNACVRVLGCHVKIPELEEFECRSAGM